MKKINIFLTIRLIFRGVKGKLKYSDFSQQTRSKTVQYFISDKNLIFETAKELLYQEKLKNSVRLLGISLNNLNTHQKKFVVYQLKFEF